MDWLRRFGRAPPRQDAAEEEDTSSRSVERAAPGIAALFAGLKEDRSHTVLDMGSADGASFRLYSAYAHRIRFADILPHPPLGAGWREALLTLSPYPNHPYDLVLLWNLLDRLSPQERPSLVERLREITAPGARLYVLLDLSGASTTSPWRFHLLDPNRVRQTAAGPAEPAYPQILPAELERLLDPFRVIHAFTLKHGSREYVAVRR